MKNYASTKIASIIPSKKQMCVNHYTPGRQGAMNSTDAYLLGVPVTCRGRLARGDDKGVRTPAGGAAAKSGAKRECVRERREAGDAVGPRAAAAAAGAKDGLSPSR